MTVAEVDLFGRTFQLTKTPEPYRAEEETFYRWSCTDAGVQVVLLRSVDTGKWKACLHFDEAEPFESSFVFWSLVGEEPDDAIKSLQESIVSIAGLLSNVLRGNELD